VLLLQLQCFSDSVENQSGSSASGIVVEELAVVEQVEVLVLTVLILAPVPGLDQSMRIRSD
jgi:hypothetical protein